MKYRRLLEVMNMRTMNNYYRVEDMRIQRAFQQKLARQIQIRNQLLILLLSALLILSVSFLFVGFSSEANNQKDTHYKYFKSIEVQKGDSLWSIANEHMDEHYPSAAAYIKEVKAMNSLSDNTIVFGQHLLIPYYSSELK